jgi:hypothetical protein
MGINALANRVTIVSGGRDGSTALRLHTEPGDNWDYVTYGGNPAVERADVNLGQVLSDSYPQREQWWEHSILFPDDYNSPPDGQGKWLVLLDFHPQSGSICPIANFQIEDDGPALGLRMQGMGGVCTSSTDRPGKYGVPIGKVVKNVWYDFVYHVKWSSGSDGFFQAWVNGFQVLDYKGPTIYIQGGVEQAVYLKLANYHSQYSIPVSILHDRLIRRAP